MLVLFGKVDWSAIGSVSNTHTHKITTTENNFLPHHMGKREKSLDSFKAQAANKRHFLTLCTNFSLLPKMANSVLGATVALVSVRHPLQVLVANVMIAFECHTTMRSMAFDNRYSYLLLYRINVK